MGAVFWLTALLAGLVIVFTWLGRRAHQRLLATIRVVTLRAVAAPTLGNSRDIFVYLPTDYAQNDSRTYPVLYLNDGQDHAAFRLHETLARLQARREMQPAIVVAIPTTPDRLREYGTAVVPNAQGLGDKAAAYAAFVVEELMPMVNNRFRTRGPALIAGVSLGGLSAFDLAWNTPGLFGTVAVFSGSFWWRAADEEIAITPGARIAHEMVKLGPHRPGLRFWLQAGTRDEVNDRDSNGVIDAIQDTIELLDELLVLGYTPGDDAAYVEVLGGCHNYETWSAALPLFLRWALAPGVKIGEEASSPADR